MTDSAPPAPGPLPFAHKGEASPAVAPASRPDSVAAAAPTLPAPRLPAETTAEDPGAGTLTSLIRRAPHQGPPRRSETGAWSPATPQLSRAAASAAAIVPRTPIDAPAPRPIARQWAERIPAAPSAPVVTIDVNLHRRRQLTLRLTTAEFARFQAFARITRSTYQNILSCAVRLFLDTLMPVSAGATDKAAIEHPTETRGVDFRRLP
jgi:hypothetical protein